MHRNRVRLRVPIDVRVHQVKISECFRSRHHCSKTFDLTVGFPNSFPVPRCGSGEVSEALTSTLKDSICICTDVNPLAAHKTRSLLAQKSTPNADMVLTDMFTALRPGTEFDVIVFNPPYVPTDEEELQRALQSRDISASWAGGKDGRQVIDKFFSEVGDFLSRNSVVYLVLLDANKPHEVMQNARRLGYSIKTVKKRKAGIEQLYILRFQRK